jgi:hypothetical protein
MFPILVSVFANASSVSAQNPEAPETIADLAAWFDADSDYITLETGVSIWTDRHVGYTLIQTGSGRQASYTESDINGRPSLTFDGSNDYMYIDETNPANNNFISLTSGSQEYTVFCIAQSDSTAGGQDFLLSWGTESASDGTRFLYQVDGKVRFQIDNTSTLQTITGNKILRDSEYHILTIAANKIEDGNADWFSRVDGQYDNVIQSNYIEQDATINSFWLGRNFVSTTEYLKGKISEIIIYNRVLTDDEINTVETYLFNKYFNPYNLDDLVEVFQAVSSSNVATEVV